ncbi:MAG TPA: hypothetical protein VKT78_02205 [Fimbriimonadaceae bacterium]|nr:hypothetical protein [Fimbriimonadaceae bacterium]
MELKGPTPRDHESAAAWLRSPLPVEEEPFGEGVDRSLVFPGALDGGIPGHIRFYMLEPIPNPEKRRYLLNAIYVLSWHELVLLFPRGPGLGRRPGPEPSNADRIRDHLAEALNLADQIENRDIARWAAAVRSVLERSKHPRYGFWCGWGWQWQWPFVTVWWP